jgi:ATP-dependent Clp protease protease subunit
MPIGVPKVPYTYTVEEIGIQWVDIYNFLFRSRMIMFGSDLDEELTNQMIGIMLFLNASRPSDPWQQGKEAGYGKELFIYINSLGGSVPCGIAVFDVLNYIESEVVTVGLGIAASMAGFILMAGGKRVLLPHARILMHQPQGGFRGQSSDLVATSRELSRWRSVVASIYAKKTGQSLQVIADHMNRDIFLQGKEAVSFGLVDAVLPFRKKKPSSPLSSIFEDGGAPLLSGSPNGKLA